MVAINQALKQKFEGKFPGTSVTTATNGIASSLQALLDGKLDLVAMGRPLTSEEKAQGLIATPAVRDKIAILVGPDNAFNGSLTIHQFAKIFRGEITDWAQVGGTPGPIRLVDRPETSDTRQAFANYPVFQSAPFQAVATATKVDDSTAAVIAQLGTDGISYATANQVKDVATVRVLKMHQTLPDDPRYPFSQPLLYVYKGPQASPAVQAFLGYAGAPDGQAAIAQARATEAAAIAAGVAAAPASPGTSSAASPVPTAIASPGTAPAPAVDASPVAVAPPVAAPLGFGLWPWILLPAALLGGLLAWFAFRGRRGTGDAAGTSLTTPGTAPELPPATPVTPGNPVEFPANPAPVAASVPAIGTALGGAAVAAGAAAGLAAARSTPPAPTGTPLPDPWDDDAPAAFTPDPVASAPIVEPEPVAESVAESVAEPEPTVEPELTVEPDVNIAASPVSETGPDLSGVAAAGAAAAGLGAIATAAMAEPEPIAVEPEPIAVEPAPIAVEPEPIAEAKPEPIAAPEPITEAVAVPEIVSEPEPIAAPEPVAEVVSRAAVTPDADFNLSGVVAAGSVAAGLGAAAALGAFDEQSQSSVEAAKFDTGNVPSSLALADVDAGLPELPNGYGDSQITLLPKDPQWAYAFWDTPEVHKAALRSQGGQTLALRVFDVTDLDVSYQPPHNVQQYDCDELARDWHVPIPSSDRDYVAEIGYVTGDGRWLMLARSLPVRVPPLFPSDWHNDHFLSVDWQDDLRGKTFSELLRGSGGRFGNPIYDRIFGLSKEAEAQRVNGSIFGSMQHVAGSVPPGSAQMVGGSEQFVGGSEQFVGGSEQFVGGSEQFAGASERFMGGSEWWAGGAALFGGSERFMGGSERFIGGSESLSSFSLAGWRFSLPTMSGVGMSGIGMSGIGLYSMSGIGMSGIGMSGIGMSGIGMSGVGLYSMSGMGMSGVGFSASMPPIRARKFWLLADAELIIYGATEPDATVYIGGQPIPLNPDGTFRFQMSFQDGNLDFPILAVAADGVQTRSIHMNFNRATPERRTNAADEAIDEAY
jgi:ABC-type phosphate transport system substrate-binding protein